MLTRTFRYLLPISLMVTTWAACAPAGPQTIDVTLSTYQTEFNPTTINKGEVKFVVTNSATDLVHEFYLVQTDLAPDQLPVKSDGTVDEESTQFTTIGSAEDIDPGKTSSFTVTLAPGHYVYFCNIEGHYAEGMRGEFTVAP